MASARVCSIRHVGVKVDSAELVNYTQSHSSPLLEDYAQCSIVRFEAIKAVASYSSSVADAGTPR